MDALVELIAEENELSLSQARVTAEEAVMSELRVAFIIRFNSFIRILTLGSRVEWRRKRRRRRKPRYSNS